MRRRSSAGLVAVVGLLLAGAGCTSSGTGGAASQGVTGTTAAQVPKSSENLCGAIDPRPVARMITGKTEAEITAVPLQLAEGQLAGCEVAVPHASPSYIVDVVLSNNGQPDFDTFRQLQEDPSLAKFNVNGHRMVWSLKANTLYAQLSKVSPAIVDGRQAVTSMLAITCKSDSPSQPLCYDQTATISANDSVIAVAEQVADAVGSGKPVPKLADAPVRFSSPGNPMLIDDRGKQISNPVRAALVFDALIHGMESDLSVLGPSGPGYREWATTQMPYLRQPGVRKSIVKSMTAHPHCDSTGCVYPGFAVTGWDTDTARADGQKLGIDPANVPDPRSGHYLTVYTSNFPACMCGWSGTIPPDDDIPNAKRACPQGVDMTLPDRTGDIDGDGKVDHVKLELCTGQVYMGQEVTAHVDFGNGSHLDQVVSTTAQSYALGWLGIADLNGDKRGDLVFIDNGGAHTRHVVVMEYRENSLVGLRGDLTADQPPVDRSITSNAGFTCQTINGHAQLLTWGAGLDDSKTPPQYTGNEETFQADESGALRKIAERSVEYAALPDGSGGYEPPKEKLRIVPVPTALGSMYFHSRPTTAPD